MCVLNNEAEYGASYLSPSDRNPGEGQPLPLSFYAIMCMFKVGNYSCGHKATMTDPQSTFLCAPALKSGLQQGVDSAQVSCFPPKNRIDYPRGDEGFIIGVVDQSGGCPACVIYDDSLQELCEFHSSLPDIEEVYMNARESFNSKAQQRLATIQHELPIDQGLIVDGRPNLEELFSNDFILLRALLPEAKHLLDKSSPWVPQAEFNELLEHMSKKLTLLYLRVKILVAMANILHSSQWNTEEALSDLCILADGWQNALEVPIYEVGLSMKLYKLVEDSPYEIETCSSEYPMSNDDHSQLSSVGYTLASEYDSYVHNRNTPLGSPPTTPPSTEARSVLAIVNCDPDSDVEQDRDTDSDRENATDYSTDDEPGGVSLTQDSRSDIDGGEVIMYLRVGRALSGLPQYVPLPHVRRPLSVSPPTSPVREPANDDLSSED